MTKEEKITYRKQRRLERFIKNKERNKDRLKRSGREKRDCPFDVEMNNMYGTCDCGGKNYNDCLGDI